MSTILDITKHPFDPASILEWMLENWSESPNNDLLVITHQGDAAALDNRLRVKLSTIRRELKNRDAKFKQFGFESDIILWTTTESPPRMLEAVCLHYRVHMRHNIIDLFDEIAK